MGLEYGGPYQKQLRETPYIPIWWRRKEYGFTLDEQLLIRGLIKLKTYEAMAKQRRCSARTIRRMMEPILVKIGEKDRQKALDIFRNFEAPVDFVKVDGE